jgi:hypothetical protein
MTMTDMIIQETNTGTYGDLSFEALYGPKTHIRELMALRASFARRFPVA